VQRELREIKEKLDVERAGGGKHPWYEIFTGPRMAYRALLGITL
jgi:SP family sugar:H+ symporter-like MFS transporter